MPKLTVQNLANLEVKVGQGQSLLKALQAQGTDWMHACGGKGRCTTCRIIVLQGMEHFGPLTDPEIRYREKGRLKDNERLTCQCTLTGGEVMGRVPDQTKLPHLTYTS
ncbi:2Fe-2S ferredoxin [Pontibacter ummariensis]|uniref:Ferredoxin, 2Fe-2S n=1 Tax=Pontibacter ummariensis TaxID=1610492 RepID=A0A239HDZ5_9BACT|nr:2Fe-2S iron-sulfur cluster-binding protein [Pontibacter ummariensis]PRY10632.1 2Fe-2S ferredoxin [Pontibacter ummariensis]SNS79512.1 ferredoxin, 2Fe-2S [Pontibacter ummariensis]